MRRFYFLSSALSAFLLLSCGTSNNTSQATPPARPQVQREFWTVRDFAAQTQDQTNLETLLYGEPEEDKPLILTLIRQLIGESLAGVEQADDETKVLHMAWYVHSHFESLSVIPYSLRKSLEHRQAECAASSTIFQLMVRSLGIKTRSTGFFGVPKQSGHTAAEVLLDNQWRYVDPSFGVLFTADGSPQGVPISLDTILLYRNTVAANALYPLASGRLGWEDQGQKPIEIQQLYSNVQMDMLASGNYRLFLAKTKAATPFDIGYAMVSKYTVDLSADPAFSIGLADHSSDDIRLHGGANDGEYDAAQLYFAGDYTGNYGPIVNSHVYYVTGLQPGQTVHFRAGFYYGDPTQVNISVRKGTLENITREDSAIAAEIKVLRRDIEIKLTVNEEERILFDYLRFRKGL